MSPGQEEKWKSIFLSSPQKMHRNGSSSNISLPYASVITSSTTVENAIFPDLPVL